MSYPTFLSWATPGPDGLAASGGVRRAISTADGLPSGRRQHHQQLQPGGAALAALKGAGDNVGSWTRQHQHYDGATGEEEEEAELKVRTALRRMGEDGVSRAWEEFEMMDPGGRRGGVLEEELVEVG